MYERSILRTNAALMLAGLTTKRIHYGRSSGVELSRKFDSRAAS